MDRIKDSTPKETWIALQTLKDAYPEETGIVLDYLGQVTHELATITEFLCEQYSRLELDPRVRERIARACSLLGAQGEKILGNWVSENDDPH